MPTGLHNENAKFKTALSNTVGKPLIPPMIQPLTYLGCSLLGLSAAAVLRYCLLINEISA